MCCDDEISLHFVNNFVLFNVTQFTWLPMVAAAAVMMVMVYQDTHIFLRHPTLSIHGFHPMENDKLTMSHKTNEMER